MSKMKSVEPLVREYLEHNPALRDDDNRLLATIWYTVLKSRIDTMSGFDVLKMVALGELPHFESVGRCRRKLQEHDVTLRGIKYQDRQKHQKKWKKEIALF